MLEPKYSLKRIFIFNYWFNESRSLNEVNLRLKKSKFEIVDLIEFGGLINHIRDYLVKLYSLYIPENINYNNATAVKSATVHPTMIYFLLLQRDNEGGLLFLFETKHSWYSYEKILHSMRAFNKNAGIRSRYIGYFLQKKGTLLTEVSIPEDESNNVT